jgi:hypothetical protein
MLETSRNKAGQICNEKATMSYFLLCVCVHVRVHVHVCVCVCVRERERERERERDFLGSWGGWM